MSIWTLFRRNALPVAPEQDALYFIADPLDATLCDAFVSGGLGNVRKIKGVGGSGGGSTAWADVTGKPTFSAVATSGAYADLSGLPTLFDGAYGSLSGVPSTFAPSAHTHAYSSLAGLPTLFSGAYADLTGKPTLGTAAAAATGDFAAASHTHTIANVTGLQTALDGKQAAGSYATAAQGAKADTAVQPAALASYQPISAVLTATTASYTTAEQSKLAGIAAGATANSADATLLARANHTGTQLAATISDFSTAADARVAAGITGKQDTLVSGTNIKTVNGASVLGSGDLAVSATAPATTIFTYDGTWQAYAIPAGATKLIMTCIGPGGNGGAGFSRTAGTAGGGGGGGGAGGITTVEMLVSRLGVSTVYAFPGLGSGGNLSYVSIAANTIAQNLLCRASAGSNATNGTATAAGGAGAAGSVSTIASTILACLGVPFFAVGQIGGAGGVHTGAVGASVTWGNTGITTSGGAGGAGCTTTDFAGGGITGNGAVVTNLAGGTAAGGAGAAGVTYSGRMMWTGGSGGGSNNSGTGGAGGAGAIGCGGGGGGAGVTGGAGGAGGNGLVMITAIF